jgi:hypothetical protein
MLALMLPLLLFAYSKVNTTKDDLAVQKAEFAATRLASLANSVGYLGGNASIIEEIEMPQNIRSVKINGNRDIVIELGSAGGVKQIVKTPDFNLTGIGIDTITAPGTYYIEVRADSVDESTQSVVLSLK